MSPELYDKVNDNKTSKILKCKQQEVKTSATCDHVSHSAHNAILHTSVRVKDSGLKIKLPCPGHDA